MNNVIEQMFSKYDVKNITDEINVLKEIIQEIVLSGLSRGNFFNEALKIFYAEKIEFASKKEGKIYIKNLDHPIFFKIVYSPTRYVYNLHKKEIINQYKELLK